MVKLTGCVLLILSTSLLGYIKAYSYKQRTHELEDILEILRILNLEITYRKEPLHKALIKCSALKQCWFAGILETCAERLKSRDDINKAWNESITSAKGTCPLCTKDTEILKDMVLGLGRSDIYGQEKIFEPAVKRIEMNLTEAKENERVQGRMYRSLGVSAGIVIAVILCYTRRTKC